LDERGEMARVLVDTMYRCTTPEAIPSRRLAEKTEAGRSMKRCCAASAGKSCVTKEIG